MEEGGKFGTKIDSFLSMFPKFYACVLGAGDGCLRWQSDSSDILVICGIGVMCEVKVYNKYH